MQNILIVVDMQNDFIDGALGTKEAVAIVPKVEEKIRNFEGKVFFTRDTHETYYLETQEGKNLPVPHCIRGTDGWQIREELDALCCLHDFSQRISLQSIGNIILFTFRQQKLPCG